ncbi:MAG: ribokinase [Proteobacteria bacterium]|nr:ribokinase [Pseudomonadota bacterium]
MNSVVVAGSINMDVVTTADRHPKIGETVAGRKVLFLPGGKGANQAIAASRLGAPTTLIGCIGRDAFGGDLRSFLAATKIDLTFLRETADAGTGTAIITVAGGDNVIVVVPGANADVNADDVAAPPLAAGDIAVSQFEIPQPAIKAFFERARAAHATTILNPAPALPCDREFLNLADILILNETELGFFAGTNIGPADDPATIIAAARSLRSDSDQIICVTLGARGFIALTRGEAHIEPGRAITAVDTTGAGDCFVGAVAAQLAQGSSIREALHYANVAASICAQRLGAAPSMPSVDEIAAYL